MSEVFHYFRLKNIFKTLAHKFHFTICLSRLNVRKFLMTNIIRCNNDEELSDGAWQMCSEVWVNVKII